MHQRAHASLRFNGKSFQHAGNNCRAFRRSFPSLRKWDFCFAEDTSFPIRYPIANFEIACYNGQTEANNLLSETISRKWRLRATVVTIPTENTGIREVIDTRILCCENYLGLGNWFIGSRLKNFVTTGGFIVDAIVRATYLTRKNFGFFKY